MTEIQKSLRMSWRPALESTLLVLALGLGALLSLPLLLGTWLFLGVALQLLWRPLEKLTGPLRDRLLVDGDKREELLRAISRSEPGDLLEQTLRLGDLRAEDVMTPRARVLSLGPGDGSDEILEAVRSSGHSRFPVLSGLEVRGVVSARRAMASRQSALEMMESPVFVPSSLDLYSLLGKMRREMVVVLDEFGDFQGVVTVEDILEELIGEVQDEHDTEELSVQQRAAGEWEISGLLRPDEVRRLTGVDLPEGSEYETVAGLLAESLQRIPDVGDRAEVGSGDGSRAHLLVLSREGLRVDRVLLRSEQ